MEEPDNMKCFFSRVWDSECKLSYIIAKTSSQVVVILDHFILKIASIIGNFEFKSSKQPLTGVSKF